ncbi:uncharacterized protein LOC130452348, partial [Diorhabda sublineata]|uniref:uncharacterized protein LOC130452348 n=1 Tax=Diorhabda sublineata TaxID=1163346 RepID=UPI0024E07F6C
MNRFRKVKDNSKKYCLVRFIEDKILYIVPTRQLTPIEGDLVWAPYKKMGFYEAHIVFLNNNRNILEKKKRDIQMSEDIESLNDMNTAISTSNLCGNEDNSRCYPTYEADDTKINQNIAVSECDLSVDRDNSLHDPTYIPEDTETVNVTKTNK